MNIFPSLSGKSAEKQLINQFAGYNHKEITSDNEFFDMKNMTGDGFPSAKVRNKRVKLMFPATSAVGVAGKDKITVAYTDDNAAAVSVSQAVNAKAISDVGAYQTIVTGAYASKIPMTWVDNSIQNSIADIYRETNKQWYDTYIYKHTGGGNLSKFNCEGCIRDNGAVSFAKQWDISADITYNNVDVYIPLGAFSRPVSSSSTTEFYVQKALNIDWSPELRNFAIGKKIYFGSNFTTGDERVETSFRSGLNGYTIRSIYLSNGSYKITVTPDAGAQSIGSITGTPAIYIKIATFNGTVSRKVKSEEFSSQINVTVGLGFDLSSLVGRTVTFSGVQEQVYVTASGTNTISIQVPHPAIPASSMLSVNALYLGTYDIDTRTISNATMIGEYDLTAKRRQMIEMGAYVLILPEKIMVNTSKIDNGQYVEVRRMEHTVTNISYESADFCDMYGTVITPTYSNTAPSSPTNGDVWVDTSTTPTQTRRYSSSISMWTTFQPYRKINLGSTEAANWNVGDSFQITDNTNSTWLDDVNQKYWTVANKTTSEIIFAFIPKGSWTTGTCSLKRSIPDMDYCVECGNRLWGCKYGENEDGEFVNEIFASKLGDPCNFHYFSNTSVDSYYVNLGSDGQFTGAVAYQSNPIFFKGDCLHRIYGSYPSNYQLKTVNGYGAEKGSSNSAVVLNDVLYYLSSVGVMAYNGSTPVKISSAFGNQKFKNAVAGGIGNKLWMCMQNTMNEHVMFCYDDEKQMWHKEDDIQIVEFFNWENECYGFTGNNALWAMQGIVPTSLSSDEYEEDLEYMLQTGNIGYETSSSSYIKKLELRVKLGSTATKCRVEIQYDSDKKWTTVGEIRPQSKVSSSTIYIMPHRCDHFALRILGKGDFTLLSISKIIYEGATTK